MKSLLKLFMGVTNMWQSYKVATQSPVFPTFNATFDRALAIEPRR
jgi:hypothetical protein